MKSKALDSDGNPQKAVKTHAGGGHDRQDAYLYGHPQGRKKRYRSPADFFPHLLWLVSDESGDPSNCSCKLCAPEELQGDDGRVVSPKDSRAEKVVTKDARPVSTPTQPIRSGATSAAKPSVDPKLYLAAKPSSAQASRQAGGEASQKALPTKIPPAMTLDQVTDREYGQFIFRPGEVVWFSRGDAWGLGLLTKRELSGQNDLRRKSYVIQPLSHPYSYPAPVTVSQEDHLRPWLAWSAPPFTSEQLNGTNVTFDTADWQGIIDKKYGYGDPEVDASIMAAKMVDASYSPFFPIRVVSISAGVEEIFYNGIYLGGEKLWVGEAARLRVGSGIDVVVVSAIAEKIASGYGKTAPRTSVAVIGDIYTFVQNGNVQLSGKERAALPTRMLEDMNLRNQVAVNAKRSPGHWKVLQVGSRLEVSELKGRWYESSLLFPILRGADYANDMRRGELGDTGLWMNGRGDPNGGMKGPGIKRQNRKDAFGASIPHDTFIGDEPLAVQSASGAGQNPSVRATQQSQPRQLSQPGVSVKQQEQTAVQLPPQTAQSYQTSTNQQRQELEEVRHSYDLLSSQQPQHQPVSAPEGQSATIFQQGGNSVLSQPQQNGGAPATAQSNQGSVPAQQDTGLNNSTSSMLGPGSLEDFMSLDDMDHQVLQSFHQGYP